jgi:hypothetical protein
MAIERINFSQIFDDAGLDEEDKAWCDGDGEVFLNTDEIVKDITSRIKVR